ncbi:MAG: maleylpyruvate isomerase N-terminal domain-containing protein [Mucilaginibacter sp.]
MDRIVPIPTLHLFPVLNDLLIDLLRSLSSEDWYKQTVAPKWLVKDVAAHLLDTNMRDIAAANNYSATPPQNINSYQDLVDYLNELNAIWIKAMDRVSPRQLIDLLESTGPLYHQYLQSLSPFEKARYAVSWAGEEESENWFHIAREYTEKWHHQQQIRDAVGKPGIMHRELFYPCIDTFMRALPHTYRDVKAREGALLKVSVSTETGGDWFLQHLSGVWVMTDNTKRYTPDASVSLTPDTSWKVFTKAMTAADAIAKSELNGDNELTRPLFGMLSVMA